MNHLAHAHLTLRTMVQYHPSFLDLHVLPTLQSANELIPGLPQEMQGKEVVLMIIITCLSSANDPEEDPTVQYIHYYLCSDESRFVHCKNPLKHSEEFQFYSDCIKKWAHDRNE
jgi:hypothetical protein